MRKILHPSKLRFAFQVFAEKIAVIFGSHLAFFIALFVIILWGLAGPFFDYSEKWQLFINSATTIVTLLMVFLIQNTQNRELNSIHLKLNELLKRAGVKSSIIDSENLSDEEREQLKEEFRQIYLKYAAKKKNGKKHDVTLKQDPVKNENLKNGNFKY